jgi:hypothetical protein
MDRPRPPVVTPPTESTQDKPGLPPSDAVVLFDGKDLSQWMTYNPRAKDEPTKEAPWQLHDGYTQEFGSSIQTRQEFADCHIHFEWRVPADVTGAGQRRGNSGFEIGDHGEIQILDSFQNDTYPDGQAAAIYGKWPPLVNASRQPGEWQSYDVFYFAPQFLGGKKVKPAIYTVLHNGLPVHHNVEVPGNDVRCHLHFRPHGGKIHFRNIWVRPMHRYDENADGNPRPQQASP